MCTLAGMLRRVTVSAVSHVNAVLGGSLARLLYLSSGDFSVSLGQGPRIAEIQHVVQLTRPKVTLKQNNF